MKILLDAVGSATIGDEILKTLESGGCQVAWYNPIRWYTLGRFNHRTHRKSLIIDGRVAFTGGAGIADQWRGNAEVPTTGATCRSASKGRRSCRSRPGSPTTGCRPPASDLGQAYYPVIDAAPDRCSVQTMLSSPETGASTVRTIYYLSIICARRVDLHRQPVFRPRPGRRIDTLIEAKRRGVDVRIMVSGIHNDNWLARQNSVRLFGRLLEAGIEILEYNRTMLHHKTMVVDGALGDDRHRRTSTTDRSPTTRRTTSVSSTAAGRQLRAIFVADLAGCGRVDWQRGVHRGAWARARNSSHRSSRNKSDE